VADFLFFPRAFLDSGAFPPPRWSHEEFLLSMFKRAMTRTLVFLPSPFFPSVELNVILFLSRAQEQFPSEPGKSAEVAQHMVFSPFVGSKSSPPSS